VSRYGAWDILRRRARDIAVERNQARAGGMNAFFWLIDTVIDLYIIVILAQVVLSWLVAFSVVNTRNRFVYMIGDFLHRATDPVLKPIRRVLPNLGGLDISPIVLILGLFFIRRLLVFDVAPALR
jgi:YggT family protein